MEEGRRPVDYAALTHEQRIDALVEMQRRRAGLDADEQRLLAVLEADPSPDLSARELAWEKQFIRDEVACALRLAFGTAARRLQIAHQLVNRLPATLDALEAGAVGYLHCRTLVEAVSKLDDTVVAKIEARVLARAGTQTVGEFARSVRRAVLALDPAGQLEQHQRAVEDRRVDLFPGQDGMATLWALLPAEDAAAIMTTLEAGTAERVPGDVRTADQRRADALVQLALDALTGETSGLPQQHGRTPAIQVCVALSTLLGMDEQPGELAGHGPIPAVLARTIAADPTGTWRRLVTDQRGVLLDYGRTTYRPPQDLQDHVIARDRSCRMPGCQRQACRCELDHLRPYHADGTTNTDNLHALCCRHHHIKHDAGWTVTREPDGTTVWTTPTRHRYAKPPATYPIDRTTDPPDLVA